MHHRAGRHQVVELRHAHAVEEVARRRGERAAHHRVAESRGGRDDSGEEHHHAQWLTAGAGGLVQLGVGERDARELGAIGLASHDGLVGANERGLEPVQHLDSLTGVEVLFEDALRVAGGGDDDLKWAARKLHREAALFVGLHGLESAVFD